MRVVLIFKHATEKSTHANLYENDMVKTCCHLNSSGASPNVATQAPVICQVMHVFPQHGGVIPRQETWPIICSSHGALPVKAARVSSQRSARRAVERGHVKIRQSMSK